MHMNIQDYLNKINNESQQIFAETITDGDSFGKVHHFSSCIFEFSEQIQDKSEKNMLTVVSAQFEASALSLALGFYRQAFSTLRLAFEMGLATVHFSIHKMEQNEWLMGKADILWSKLIDEENGILSSRFSEAFFKELETEVRKYNRKAAYVYRMLSQYVHGNNETWIKSGLIIKKNEALISLYFEQFDIVAEIILFALSSRYIKSFSADQLDSVSFIKDHLNHVSPLREFFEKE